MTEVTTPLAAAPKETDAETSAPVVGLHSISLRELIAAHFEWWRDQRRDQVRAATRHAYDAAVADFERRHGEIVNAYWCAHVESAVVLTREDAIRGVGDAGLYVPSRDRLDDAPLPEIAVELTAATSSRCGHARS